MELVPFLFPRSLLDLMTICHVADPASTRSIVYLPQNDVTKQEVTITLASQLRRLKGHLPQ
jgi:hypothetical protein